MTTVTVPRTRTAPARVDEPTGALFPAVAHSEWTKLRSVRSTVWTLVATFGITVGFGLLFSLAYVSRYDHLSLHERLTFDATAQSLRGLFLAQVAIGVLGVLFLTSEYATGAIRATMSAVPQRRLLLGAKAAVFAVVAVPVAMVSAFTAFFAGQAVLDGKNVGVALSDPGVLRAVLGTGVYLAMIGLLALAIGAIVRRTAGAIATLFGLVFVLPLLTQALPSPWNDDISKFVPGGLGAALYSVRADGNLLSPGVAFLVLVVWVAVAFTIATVLIERRDV
jgi:hypothetical protein